MSTQNQITNTDIDEVVKLINQGIESWIVAGKLVVKNVEKNPNFIDQVCDKYKDISPEILYRFEQIGRKQLNPRLLLNDSPGVRRLRRLPIEVQEKHAVEPVAVLISEGQTLQIDVRNLTPRQAAQVFNCDRLRSLAEQRAWIEDKKTEESTVPAQGNLPYRIVGKTLIVMQGCKFTVRDLARIMAEMEA